MKRLILWAILTINLLSCMSQTGYPKEIILGNDSLIAFQYNQVREINKGLEELEGLDDEEVIIELTKLNGIGRWSAEMFLMFSLGREDVFSYGDLGLRRAIQKLYKLKTEPTQKKAEKIANKWKPYRTYACRILWRSVSAE